MQFGKPSRATYEFAEQVLKSQIEELYGSVKMLPNMYAPFRTLRYLYSLSFYQNRYMVGGNTIKYNRCESLLTALPIPSDNPESGMNSLLSDT
jgi:hypothetical protein